MKNFLVLSFLLITTTSFAIKTYTLDELKENPKFEVSINANGEYTGNSIELKVVSSNKKDVELLIPAGTVFYTSDEGDQILILMEEQLLVIAKGRTKKKVLDGYCTEMNDGVPGEEMAMAYMPTKREKLQQLANFINENKGFDNHTIQEAVWCVSDGQSLANIYSADKKKSEKLTKFVAELTGQEVTWHKVKRRLGHSGGQIQVNPVMVTGNVSFSTPKKITLKSKIVDAEGNMVYENPKAMPVPKMDEVEMEFNLSVAGWDKGTYFVVYYDEEDNTILKKEFSI